MGNEQNKANFDMNVQLIGEGMIDFFNIIKSSSRYKTIKDYWTFEYEEGISINEQLQNYFNKLENEKEKKNNDMKESLILKVNNLKDDIIEKMIEKMDKLEETYFMPLVLILYENKDEKDQKIEIDEDKYQNIEPRLIFIEKYEVNRNFIEDNIEPKLLRFCSIHNELGDRIEIDNKESFDLIDNYFPFNLNIACIGRFGQGKSTGVNMILKEYKAKESSKGSSQTKSLTFYQVTNKPIRILDIPGFENEDTVKKALKQLKKCGKKINQIKDNLHIILYFFNYNDKRSFMALEKPILEEILQHNSSKIIYVITNSIKNIKEQQIKKTIQRINSGLETIFNINNNIINDNNEIMENQKKYERLKASDDNTVFVNFLKNTDLGTKPFGIDKLFQKIHDYFEKSDDCKNLMEKLSPEAIEKKVSQLREEAEDALLANKIWGGAVGIVPGVDLLVQKFLIKKNALKKVGKIFGIDVKFVNEVQKTINKEKIIELNEIKDEENNEIKDEEKVKKKNEIKNEIKDKKKDKKNDKQIDKLKEENKKEDEIFNNPNIDETSLNTIKEKDVIKGSIKNKVCNGIRITSETGAYVGSGFSIGAGVTRFAGETFATATTIGLSVCGIGLGVVGVFVGVGLGGYLTHKFCENLIDKFVNFYKENANKISNSYKEALEYFNQNEDKEEKRKNNLDDNNIN